MSISSCLPLPADPAAWDGMDLPALMHAVPLGGDRFEFMNSQRNVGGEIFGGQYLGQALSAALATGHGRAPLAISGLFMEAARADRTLVAHVQRLRDGRSFAHRRVTLLQEERPVFCADVTLHDPEPNQPHHQISAPQVEAPESLRSLEELLATHGEQAMRALTTGDRRLNNKSVELRLVDARAGLIQRGHEPRSAVWLRARSCASNDPLMQYAVLAYMSDHWANFACRVMHADSVFAGELLSSSLNHSITFHQLPIVSDWLLYVTESPCTSGGVGLTRGCIFDRAGRLLASTTQDALVRKPRT